MEKDRGAAGKKVGTSELLDWLRALQGIPEAEAMTKLKSSKLPFRSVLLKTREQSRYG